MKISCETFVNRNEKNITFATSMKMMEMARRAAEIIALAKRKNLPAQAAKMKSYQRHESTTYV
jgi:hypothetical protein